MLGQGFTPPADYIYQQGWVLIAFRNALWQLLHAPNLEEGVVDTVMRGGDTDTNAAIVGALLGAVYGRNAIPNQWLQHLLNCRPLLGQPHVLRPRPECFWPVDALQLAERLVSQTNGMQARSTVKRCIENSVGIALIGCKNSNSQQSSAQQPPQGQYTPQAYTGKIAHDDGQ